MAWLVAAADFLFYGHTLGCSAAIYTVVLLTAILQFGTGVSRGRAVLLLGVLVAGLALALAEEPTPLALLMTALGFTTLALTQRHGWTSDVGVWLRRAISLLGRAVVQWARDLRIVVRRCDVTDLENQEFVGLRRWLPAAGLGVVFLALFAVANPVLAGWLEGVAKRIFNLSDLLDAPRVLFWIVVAVIAWAALRTRAGPVSPAPASAATSPISGFTLVRSLWVFNLLFLLQNALDVRHLLFDAALPEGVTYAGYARRGAYPLLAAALLSAAFVLTTFRSERDRFGVGARRLVYAFLAQNVILTAFAMLRLMHYVDAYSLSRMRLAAFLWMGLVALGLALIFVRIVAHRSNRWLLSANALAAVTLLYVCCFPNWDRFIADYNVAHSREVRGYGGQIDLDYLRELGPDALPAYRRLQQEATDETIRQKAAALADAARGVLDDQLDDWRGWTFRRRRLRDAEVDR